MELTFPFKNMAINDLLRLLKPGFLYDYIEAQYKGDKNEERNVLSYVNLFRNALPNFENELLQVINTTTQETIDHYFRELHDNVTVLRERLTEKYILNEIVDYNYRVDQTFTEKIEKLSEDFFNSENRNRPHLSTFEDYEFNFFLGIHSQKVTRVNYNFYCVQEIPSFFDTAYFDEIYPFFKNLADEFFEIANRYGKRWSKGEIKAKHPIIKPVLYVEGELDVRFLEKAANLLGFDELLTEIDIRQRGGFVNLDHIWNALKKYNWETIRQPKLLLYDCDTEKIDADLGYIFKRVIPSIENNPIRKGIENLFSISTINKVLTYNKALVDITNVSGTERGVDFTKTEMTIHHNEKTNFCTWLCENGTKDDFEHFSIVFAMIQKLLLNK